MDNKKNLVKNKGILKNFIITCPVCGYRFPKFTPKNNRNKLICPICGYKFIRPHFHHRHSTKF
ncbi:MAG: hypothetical protein ACTSUL_05920 [Promethearchaeota archaeon]